MNNIEEKYFGRVEYTPKSPSEIMDIFNAALRPRYKWWKNPIRAIKSKIIKEPEWTLIADLTISETVWAARQARLDKLKEGRKQIPEEYLEEILAEHYRSLEMTQEAIRVLEQKIKVNRKENER